MASSIWSWFAFAALLLPTGGVVLWLLRQRSGLRNQVAALAHDVEALNDRLWNLADSEERYRSLIEAQGLSLIHI